MNGENNEQNNQTVETQDFRTVQPEILGELRKDKIGKPILVIELFVLFAVVLVSLPILNKLIYDENSQLYKFLHGTSTSGVSTPTVSTTSDTYSDGSVTQTLDSNTNMKMDAIIMKNFQLSNSSLIVTMSSYTGVLDLDAESYFLEIYSSSGTLVTAVKLVGTFDNQEKEVSLKAKNLSFNSSYTYVGKIVKMTDGDYPDVTISTDESGIGSFTCKNDTRSIEYVFQNKYLIKIVDEVKEKVADYSEEDYLADLNSYRDKATALGTNAIVEEVSDGFRFAANIDLLSTKVPDSIVDYNYYELNADAKVIKYTLEGKGFDCGE